MRLNKNYIILKVGEKQYIVPKYKDNGDKKFLIENNETAAFILKFLENETSETDIVDAIVKKYDVSKEKAELDIHSFVSILVSKGLIE